MPIQARAVESEEVDLSNYFSITYKELFKAHVLDVHLPNMLLGISSSVEVPLVTILGRRINASYSDIADYITVSALARTMLDIPIGIIVEYVGVRNVMFLCLLLNVAASVIGFHVVNGPTLFAFCLLSGLSLGGFFLARHIFVAGISSKKYRGLLMAILSGLLRWSHVIGPVASGLFATYLGDVKYSFILSAATSLLAFITLAIATYSSRYQEHLGEHSSTASLRSSAMPTPLATDSDGDHHTDTEHDARGGKVRGASAGAAGPYAPLNSAALAESDAYTSTPLLPLPPAAPPRGGGGAGGQEAAGDHRHIVGAETSVLVPQLGGHYAARTHHTPAPAVDVGSASVASTATTVTSLRPQLGASRVHHFRVLTLWSTFVDYWSVIWRLGLYVVFATAMRANRKLLVSFAGMRAAMTDAQVSYLLGFSFVFDALLFPLGGLVMDLLGRQFAMVPVAVGLGVVFFFLPFATTEMHLYMAASAFGIVDALGCGLIMTLTADRAPPRYGAPFFGIMRTLQDLGHVVGARGVSSLMRYAGFRACCWTLTATGFLTALWGVYGVPRDSDLPGETPRLERAVMAQEQQDSARRQSCSQSSEETVPLTRLVEGSETARRSAATPPTVATSYGTAEALPARR